MPGSASQPSALPTNDSGSQPPVPDGRRARTARAIIEAASTLFDGKGLQHTTIDEIAEAAGVSVGSVYGHYGSKEALYHSLVEQAIVVLAEYMSGAKPAETPLGRVFAAGNAYASFGLDHPVMFRLVAAHTHQPIGRTQPSELEQRITDRLEALVFTFGDDLRAAMKTGQITTVPANHAMLFLWASWSSVISLSLRDDRLRVSRDDLVATLDIAGYVLARGLGADDAEIKRATGPVPGWPVPRQP